MNVDPMSEPPEKPNIGQTSRANYQRVSSSHERSRFKKNTEDKNKPARMTAAERMFSKNFSQEEEDDLSEYYGGKKSRHAERTPNSKSKSRSREKSKESTKRIKQL